MTVPVLDMNRGFSRLHFRYFSVNFTHVQITISQGLVSNGVWFNLLLLDVVLD